MAEQIGDIDGRKVNEEESRDQIPRGVDEEDVDVEVDEEDVENQTVERIRSSRKMGRKTTNSLAELGLKFDEDGVLDSSTVKAAAQDKTKQQKNFQFMRRVTCVMAVAVLLTACSSFVMSYWATSLLKDTEVADDKNGVALTGTSGDIVQVSSAEVQVELMHTLVVDMAHLRTMNEIAYTVYGEDGATWQRSEKVSEVERYQGPVKSDVNVSIRTYTNRQIILDLKLGSPWVLEGGKRYPICGEMKCANFKINDPEINIDLLDKRLDVIRPTEEELAKAYMAMINSNNDNNNKTGNGRRLLWDFGCCSGGLATGGPDGADCNTAPWKHTTGAGYQLSESCRTHDSCLLGCNGDCGCRGNCDRQLAANAAGDSCWKGWGCSPSCIGLKPLLIAAMLASPNQWLLGGCR